MGRNILSRSLTNYIMPVLIGLAWYYTRCWPHWMSEKGGLACCFLPMVLSYLRNWLPQFDQLLRPLEMACYLVLAALAMYTGVLENRPMAIYFGVFIALKVLESFTPVRNALHASLMLLLALIGCETEWTYPIFQTLIPLAAVPVIAGLLLRLRCAGYLASALYALLALAFGTEALHDLTALGFCVLMLVAVYTAPRIFSV